MAILLLSGHKSTIRRALLPDPKQHLSSDEGAIRGGPGFIQSLSE